jgi:hypothetical protein
MHLKANSSKHFDFINEQSGMTALAPLLLGHENRWGRLATTMYKSTYVEAVPLIEYSQSKWPGRTYKYVDPSFVIYPFGAGMGYHNSSITCSLTSTAAATYADADVVTSSSVAQQTEAVVGAMAHAVHCTVAHVAGPAGDEVVQVYHVPPAGLKVDHPLPFKRLIAFDRIHLPSTGKKKPGLCPLFNSIMIVLPRQAQDKYQGRE